MRLSAVSERESGFAQGNAQASVIENVVLKPGKFRFGMTTYQRAHASRSLVTRFSLLKILGCGVGG